MGHRDVQKDGWERSDLPMTCNSCLGDNPYVRMTKANYDRDCKICTRPLTVFRWRPGRDSRYKKTEICQTCSKLKNVCQICLLDLQHGLPVEVLVSTNNSNEESIPRVYLAEEHDGKARAGLDYSSRPNDTILKQLERRKPYYKRNRAHVCSFYVRGVCTRGAECPYRHEMPVTGELSKQNIKDRYYGINDPVAAKLLNRARPREDESIRRTQQEERAYYPSTDPQRMGALLVSDHMPPPPPQGQFQHSFYPYEYLQYPPLPPPPPGGPQPPARS